MSKQRRGMSLANTLVASSVLVTLAFATVSLVVSQLTLTTRLDNKKLARDLAESAASDCLAQIVQDPRWSGDSQIALGGASGGWGRASFSAATAKAWGILASTNNLNSDVPGQSQADGNSLPAASLQLISFGNYRGQRLRVSQLIVIPPFKYALSSTGEITSNGGLTVGSVEDPALLADGFDSLLDDQLKAGHIAGNKSGADSVTLNATQSRPVLIKGEVDSAGNVTKTSHAKVLGGVRENREPVPLPDIVVKDYDPIDRSDVVKLSDSTQTRLTVDTPIRQKGDLKITSGLEMTKGYLYVDGDLDVYGGITGKGAIFATGDIKIHGVSTFGANNQQAIVAHGDVRIEGQGRNQSTFQGVIYTEGDFHGKDITLVGSLVANKSSSGSQDGSQMTLDSCNVVYNRQIMNTVWNSGFQPNFTPQNPAMSFGLQFDSGGGTPKGIKFQLDPKAKDFYDPKLDQYRPEYAPDSTYYDMAVLIPRSDGKTEKFASMSEAIRILSDPNNGLPISVPPNPGEVEAVRQANAKIAESNKERELRGEPLLPYQPEPTSMPSWAPSVLSKLRQIEMADQRSNTMSLPTADILRQQVTDFNDYYVRTKALWMHQGEFGFSLNPNQFISMSDKARRMTWSDE